MRRVLAQQSALFQRLHDQREVALLQVAHAAVHQLGAAAGSAFPEVALFQQKNVIAAAGGVDGHAHSGGSATHYNQVPGARVRAETAIHLRSCHG